MNNHFSFLREVRNILNAVAVAISKEPPEGEWNQIKIAISRTLLPFQEAHKAEGVLGQLPEALPS